MPNETEDYNNFVRANLPAGMSYSANRYRYNNHSFYVFELAAWYYYYLLRVNSPSNLFSASEVGVWYDPSDLTTLFQDSAGTTPVTAAGQPVGLMLDKSKSLALGAELVTNGTFSSGTTGWTVSGTTLSVVGGRLAVTSASAGSVGVLVNNGAPYAVGLFDAIFDIEPPTGRTVSTYVRNASAPAYSTPQVGVTVRRQSTNTTEAISFFWSAAAAGEVLYLDNVSVRQILGNHATQATSAQRPTYGIHPYSGVRNLLRYSEQFDNAAWVKTIGGTGVLPVVTANFGTAPDGTMTADRVQFDSGAAGSSLIQQNRAVASGFTYVYSVWMRSLSADVSVTIFTLNLTTNVTVTSEWQRFQLSSVSASTAGDVRIAKRDVWGTTGSADLLVWGAQQELGSTPTAYQKVVTQYEVTEAGVPSVHYIGFDGVDDGMVTSAIDFSTTDAVTVFTGLRKLSDAARAVVVELGNAISAGLFRIQAPNTSLSNYDFAAGGTIPQTLVSTSNPPVSVVTGIADISGDLAALRLNGAQQVQNTSDQGTGNFSNAPLYIGRRGGSSLPFNGNLYSLIVRGAQSTAAQITNTETWVNQKTGAF